MNVDPVTFAKALSDDTRQEIMTHLCCVWLSVNDVVDKLGGKVNQPTVSHHLKKLEEANLVIIRQEGRQRFYTLNQQQITVCCDSLVWAFAPDRAPLILPNVQMYDSPDDVTFIEGKRTRINHLQIERDAQLRKVFLAKASKPILCDICETNLDETYPWTRNLIEIHYLLPLSSDVAFQRQTTRLDDVVALCPNCHKSVHAYYVQWLNSHAIDDFLSADDARTAYLEAKILARLRVT